MKESSCTLIYVVFLQTGTLTEDGLEVWGVVEVQGGQLGQPVTEVTELPFTSRLVAAMASCHSLTYLHGSLTGDPLDIKMFEATKWVSSTSFSPLEM